MYHFVFLTAQDFNKYLPSKQIIKHDFSFKFGFDGS